MPGSFLCHTVSSLLVSLPSRLGLTREEPPPENPMQDDAENRTSVPAPEEPAQLHHGPVTRQRDGHFRKRSLRCWTRKSLYKACEPEQAETAKEVLPVESEPPERSETRPDVDLGRGSQAPPEPEALPEAAGAPSQVADGEAVAGRLPSVPQEPQDQESKEQKRKCLEQAASASFPEKKPRLEDRQSFRNTIESVHPEKPQPTKEEPKVPPIRVGERLALTCCLGAVTVLLPGAAGPKKEVGWGLSVWLLLRAKCYWVGALLYRLGSSQIGRGVALGCLE